MHRFFVLLLILLSACTPEQNRVLPTLAPNPDSIRALPYWETVSGTISTIGGIEYWQFVGDAGAPIFLAVVSRAEYNLRLYQGDVLLAEGQRIELSLPASDLYRVEVHLVSGADNYDLGLGYTDRPNPNDPTPLPVTVAVPTPTPPYVDLGEFIGSITMPAPYPGLLSAVSPRHIYTLEGRRGQIVSFELYRIGGTFDPVVRLYDPDGALVAEDDDALGQPNARLLNIVLPMDGLYSVQVDGKGLFGDYTLVFVDGEQTVNPDRVPTAMPTTVAPYVTPAMAFAVPDMRLEDHVPAINSLARPGDFQRFSFYADAGETVSVRVAPMQGSTLLPQLELFNPAGEQVAIAQASTNPNSVAAVMGLVIAETGLHSMIITGENNSAGQFTVAYGRGVTVQDDWIGIAFSNGNHEEVLDIPGSRQVWELRLNPGDVITVTVRPNNELFDPVVELATADGTVLHRDDNSAGNRGALLSLVEITEPATYILRVYDATGANTGGYSLIWHYINLAATATAIPSLTSLLSINGEVELGNYQFFAFQGLAGQELLIDVTALDALDPVLVLLAPNGEIIAENDDSNGLNPSLRLRLEESGTYKARVNGYLTGGAFRLRVALVWN